MGPDVPIKIELGYRDMKIDFGLEGHDVSLEFVLAIQILPDGLNRMNLTRADLIFFDELPMVLSLNIELQDNIFYANI